MATDCITTTEEPCEGNYLSTDCVATPTPITTLNLAAGATQTEINAALLAILLIKGQDILKLQQDVNALTERLAVLESI